MEKEILEDFESMKPIIFIPVYNDLLEFKEVIESIYSSTMCDFDLLIIESDSTDGAKEYCDLLPKLYNNVEIIHTQKEGALRAYNQAFLLARDRHQDIYMTQTDAVHFKFRTDWLFEMIKLSELPNCGCVIMKNSQGVCHGRYIEGMPWAGFWGVYIPFETIEKIGGFDEGYEIGDAVDIDWTYRMFKAGLNMIPSSCFNDHHHRTAHTNEQRSDLEDIRERNGEYFLKKYNLK